MTSIQCKWNHCGEFFDCAETLYSHLCDQHIGRKSQNNLQLNCRWEGCSAMCAKRDHITSHLRVHVGHKPHACQICKKSFKRPQDLKKHEKIHTEEHHATHKYSKATIAPVGQDSTPTRDSQADKPAVALPLDASAAAALVYQQAAAAQQVTLANLVAHQHQLNAVHAAHLMGLQSGMPPPFSAEAQALADLAHQRILAGQPLPMINYYAPFSWPPGATPAPAPTHLMPSMPPVGPHPTPAVHPTTTPTASPPSFSKGLYPTLPVNFVAPQGPPTGSSASPSPSPRHDPASPGSHATDQRGSIHKSPYSSAEVSPPESHLSPGAQVVSPPLQPQTGAANSRKRGLEGEMLDMVQDVKRGKLSDPAEIGKRLDNFTELFAQPDLLAPPLLSVRSASSDGSACSDPPELASDQVRGQPQLRPDLSKHEVDTFNEFLLGLAEEYETPVNAGHHTATWNHATEAEYTHKQDAVLAASLYPQLHSSDAYAQHMTPKMSTYASSGPMYPSIASLIDLPMPVFEAHHPSRSMPPPHLSSDYRRDPVYHRVEKLQAAPIGEDDESDATEGAEELSHHTSSLRSTYESYASTAASSSSRASSVFGDSQTSSRTSTEESLRLAPLRKGAPVSRAPQLPSLRTIVGDALASEKMAHVTNGVGSLAIARPAAKIRSFDESGSMDDESDFPHKKTKTVHAAEADVRRKRLAAIKALIVLANSFYRMSIEPQKLDKPIKAEEPATSFTATPTEVSATV